MFQRLWDRFLRVGEYIVDALEQGCDHQDLQTKVPKELDGLGRDILCGMIEAADEHRRLNASERSGRVVDQRNLEEEFLTSPGPIRYTRQYFKHSASKT